MTTSEYDELAAALRERTEGVFTEEEGFHTGPDALCVQAADAITRLTREKAEARAQGAEEMRSSVIAAILSIPVSSDDAPITMALAQIVRNALSCAVKAVESLPLPSPIAAQAVPEGWKPIETAALGQSGMFWHPSWRSPFPGMVNGDYGAVYLDTPTPEHGGAQMHATHWRPYDLPLPSKPPGE